MNNDEIMSFEEFGDDIDSVIETFTDAVFQSHIELKRFKGLNSYTLEKFKIKTVVDPKTDKKELVWFNGENYFRFSSNELYRDNNVKLFGSDVVNHEDKDLFICDNPLDAMYLSQELKVNAVSVFCSIDEINDSYDIIDGKRVFFVQSGKMFKDIQDYIRLPHSKTITLNRSVKETYNIHKNIKLVGDYINGARLPNQARTSDIGSMIENGIIKERSFGHSTGIRQLDKITRGFSTDLIGVGAGTGCGKTTFVTQLAYEMMKQGNNVGCLFFEQDDEYETLLNMIGHYDRINYNHLLGSEIEDFEYDYEFEEKEKVVKNESPKITPEVKADLLNNYINPRAESVKDKLHIMSSDVGDISVEDTLKMIRAMVIQQNCKLIVLDHTTYLTDGADNQNQAAQVLMKGLKDIMHTHKVSIIYITHLRKSKSSSDTHEEGARVKLDDFAGGKAVVQYATVVLGLERDMHNEDPELAEITKLRLLKRRGMGVVPGESVIDMKYSLECNKLYPANCHEPQSGYTQVPF